MNCDTLVTQALQIVTCAAAMVIIVRTFPSVVSMCGSTMFGIKISIHFLLVGAIGEAGAIAVYGWIPSWPTSIATIGIACLLLCERRLRDQLGPNLRAKQQDPRGVSL